MPAPCDDTGRVVAASHSPAVDAVVFDLGGVLIDWNPRHLYRQLFDDEAAMERFLASVCTNEWHADHDRGVSTAESCELLAAEHPEHAELIRAWAERSEDMVAGAIDETVEILAELKRTGVRLFVLSNMEPETFPLRLDRFEFLHWFDDYVISGYEGLIKPDPAIFRRLLRRFDLQPARTLFIDDNEANVDAACAIGIKAVLFDNPEQLREHLVNAGLL